MIDLTGRVALVTGAARGIGAATAEILAGEGAHVVVLDRPADDQPASEVARKIGGSVLLADVSDPKAPEQIASLPVDRRADVFAADELRQVALLLIVRTVELDVRSNDVAVQIEGQLVEADARLLLDDDQGVVEVPAAAAELAAHLGAEQARLAGA